MNLADRLQEFRKQSGMSQEELAEKLDVSRQAVSKWESGAAKPELTKLVELARIYNVSLDDLLQVDIDTAAIETERESTEKEKTTAPVPKGKKAWILILLALLIVSWVIQSERIQNLESRLVGTETYVINIVDDLNTRISDIYNSIENAASQNSLINDWRYEIAETNLLKQEVLVNFYLTPKSVTDKLAIEVNLLNFEEAGSQSLQVPLTQNGYVFSAENVSVPLSDEISVAAVLDYGAEKQLQNLDPIYDLKSNSMLSLQPSWSGTSGTYYDGYDEVYLGMRFDGQIETTLTLPAGTHLTDGAAEVLVNDTVMEAVEIDIDDVNNLMQQYEASQSVTCVQTLQTRVPCSNGDQVSIRVTVTDSLGIRYSQEAVSFLYTYVDGVVDVEHMSPASWMGAELEVEFPTE